MRTSILLLFFLFTGNAWAQQRLPEADLLDKLKRFCEDNMGKKVGSGDAWGFLESALLSANAEYSMPEKLGNAIDPQKDGLRAGDILVMEKVAFTTQKSKTLFLQKHFGIVKEVNGSISFSFYSQNIDQSGIVTVQQVEFSGWQIGALRVYRPYARQEAAKIIKTEILVYTQKGCQNCEAVKADLTKRGVSYTELGVENMDNLDQMWDFVYSTMPVGTEDANVTMPVIVVKEPIEGVRVLLNKAPKELVNELMQLKGAN